MDGEYQTPTNVDEVRAYVLGGDSGQSRSQQDRVGILVLQIEHTNLKLTRLHEIRLDGTMTLDAVKQRLYLHTGTRPATMRLYLHSTQGRELKDDRASLFQSGVTSGDTLMIVDDDPFSASANGWLEDTSLVPKYELSEEAYNKKENTYRKFKQRMREKDPNWSLTSALRNKQYEKEPEPTHIKVNDRVKVYPGDKRGCVRYVGKSLEGLPAGWWIGVEYDEPVGKNDGSVKGNIYFSCAPKYGGFVRVSNVTVGDFPPLGIDDEEDEL